AMRSAYPEWGQGKSGNSAQASGLLHSFRSGFPVRVTAKCAVRAEKHASGVIVALEVIQQPVTRHIGEFAAPRVVDGGRVSGIVAGAVESGHLLHLLEVGARGGHQEV